MIVEFDVPIEMDDGTVLCADVFRPADDGAGPVLLTYGPYGKGLHFADGYPDQWEKMTSSHPDIPAGSTNRYQSWELPDPEKWVPHGYVCVRVDSRGAGRSPGYIDPWSTRETDDLVACIEWAGTRPWSTGKVGLTGISYYAMNAWHAAARRPAHLAAICSWEGTSDIYREMVRQGGILCAFVDKWYVAQVESVQHGLAGLALTSRETGLSVAGDVALGPEAMMARRLDLPGEIRRHALFDEFWAARTPDLSAIEVPLLSAANWGGPPHLRGNVEGFVQAGSPQKWLEFHGLEHWTHFYTDYGRGLQKEFFDHFLLGKDNGWADRKSIILNARRHDGTFESRAEDEWPLPDTIWTKFFLDLDQCLLVSAAPAHAQLASYAPLDEEISFSYTAATEMEVTGPLAVRLYLSSSTVDADVFVTLRLFDKGGDEVTFVGNVDPAMAVTSGWLRASMRNIDASKSLAHRPVYTFDRSQPLTPHEIYELDVEILPTSIVIPAGYTIVLAVHGVDYSHAPVTDGDVGWTSGMSGVGPFRHDDPDDRPAEIYGGTVTLHAGPDHRAHLLVPVIPRS